MIIDAIIVAIQAAACIISIVLCVKACNVYKEAEEEFEELMKWADGKNEN